MQNLYNSFGNKFLQDYLLYIETMNYRDDFSIDFKKLNQYDNTIRVKINNKIESHGPRSKSQNVRKIVLKKRIFPSLAISNANISEDKYLRYEDEFYYENNKSKDSIGKQSLKSFLCKYKILYNKIAYEEFENWKRDLIKVKGNVSNINKELKEIKGSIKSLTSTIEEFMKKEKKKKSVSQASELNKVKKNS